MLRTARRIADRTSSQRISSNKQTTDQQSDHIATTSRVQIVIALVPKELHTPYSYGSRSHRAAAFPAGGIWRAHPRPPLHSQHGPHTLRELSRLFRAQGQRPARSPVVAVAAAVRSQVWRAAGYPRAHASEPLQAPRDHQPRRARRGRAEVSQPFAPGYFLGGRRGRRRSLFPYEGGRGDKRGTK